MNDRSAHRIQAVFTIADTQLFRTQLAEFARPFTNFALLDSCANTVYGEPAFDYMLAADALAFSAPAHGNAFGDLKAFVQHHSDWCFGFLSYELNAETESISPSPQKIFDVPALRFFIPRITAQVCGSAVTITLVADKHWTSPRQIFEAITAAGPIADTKTTGHLEPLIRDTDYIQSVHTIQQHIIDGDIYELNYCQPFATVIPHLDPISIFNRLCSIAKAPFSVLHRFDDQYVMCASPERFFQFNGKRMRSMPIKGTRRRGNEPMADAAMKLALAESVKDRAEHVMIVDLVRNDLTPFAVPGSIEVDELFGLYSFEQVHHMVSVISAELREDAHIIDALRQAFPMGSMTGAPKVRAMQLAAQYEPYQRGIYSGALGYFTPEGHCDFNVVIRSLFYSAQTHRLAAYAGGAIVYDSVAEQELEECMVKLAGIRKVLGDAE